MGKHSHVRVYFTPEVADEILDRLSAGESLMTICGPDREPGIPNRVTVHKYIREDRDFREAYLIAREVQAHTLAEETIPIADGLCTQFGQAPNVGRDYLRVYARHWMSAAMAPRAYGRHGVRRDALAEMEAVDDATQTMGSLERAGRIAALFEEARRRRIEMGQEMTGDLLVDLQAALPGDVGESQDNE
jgi:hypothetical protein